MISELCHVLAEFMSSENVEVHMLNRLTTVISDVADYAISIRKFEFSGNLRYNGENVRDRAAVLLAYLVDGGNMLLGNYKAMNRSLRIYVKKGVAGFILINLL